MMNRSLFSKEVCPNQVISDFSLSVHQRNTLELAFDSADLKAGDRVAIDPSNPTEIITHDASGFTPSKNREILWSFYPVQRWQECLNMI